MPSELFTDTPRRVIAVYAHPDDADVACGGTLAKWVDAGSSIDLVVCAAGDKGSADPTVVGATLAKQRVLEVEAAAAVIGLREVHWLDRLDGEFENDLHLRRELVALFRDLRPEVLVCPDPTAVFFGEHYYNHRDHRVTGFGALDAAAPAAALPLYFPESRPSHQISYALLTGSLDPNISVEVTETIARKAAAVMCHVTQLGDTPESMRAVIEERAAGAGRGVGVEFAEAFRRVWLRH